MRSIPLCGAVGGARIDGAQSGKLFVRIIIAGLHGLKEREQLIGRSESAFSKDNWG